MAKWRKDFVFILYANESHSDVGTDVYMEMTQPNNGSLERIVEAFVQHNVPAVISTQGIDIDLLSIRNPALLHRMLVASSLTSANDRTYAVCT